MQVGLCVPGAFPDCVISIIWYSLLMFILWLMFDNVWGNLSRVETQGQEQGVFPKLSSPADPDKFWPWSDKHLYRIRATSRPDVLHNQLSSGQTAFNMVHETTVPTLSRIIHITHYHAFRAHRETPLSLCLLFQWRPTCRLCIQRAGSFVLIYSILKAVVNLKWNLPEWNVIV